MTIREAMLADVDRITEMAGRFLEDQTLPYRRRDWRRSQITDLLAFIRLNGIGLVAEVDGQIVGMIGVAAVPDRFSGELVAEELAWWVEPEHRNGSIGPRLLREAEAWATRTQLPQITMIVPHGTDVGRFLERSGYAPLEAAFVKRL